MAVVALAQEIRRALDGVITTLPAANAAEAPARDFWLANFELKLEHLSAKPRPRPVAYSLLRDTPAGEAAWLVTTLTATLETMPYLPLVTDLLMREVLALKLGLSTGPVDATDWLETMETTAALEEYWETDGGARLVYNLGSELYSHKKDLYTAACKNSNSGNAEEGVDNVDVCGAFALGDDADAKQRAKVPLAPAPAPIFDSVSSKNTRPALKSQNEQHVDQMSKFETEPKAPVHSNDFKQNSAAAAAATAAKSDTVVGGCPRNSAHDCEGGRDPDNAASSGLVITQVMEATETRAAGARGDTDPAADPDIDPDDYASGSKPDNGMEGGNHNGGVHDQTAAAVAAEQTAEAGPPTPWSGAAGAEGGATASNQQQGNFNFAEAAALNPISNSRSTSERVGGVPGAPPASASDPMQPDQKIAALEMRYDVLAQELIVLRQEVATLRMATKETGNTNTP